MGVASRSNLMGLLSAIGLDDVDVKTQIACESIFPSFDSAKYPI